MTFAISMQMLYSLSRATVEGYLMANSVYNSIHSRNNYTFQTNHATDLLEKGLRVYHKGTLRVVMKLPNTCLNPLSPNSDQHQISPCNINAYSTPEVMRIKDMIT